MKILLASNSPRRRELLQGLDIPFKVIALPDVDESYPSSLLASRVAEFIARKKAAAYCHYCKQHTSEHTDEQGVILLTADTVVVCDGDVLGKPHDEQEAFHMLRQLSGKTHQVYTGYCLTPIPLPSSLSPSSCAAISSQHPSSLFTLHSSLITGGSVCTDVTFKNLTDEEIHHYIETYKPFDKAGAYGIQEWIGYIGITGINGSYYNVMGLPVQRIYEDIKIIHNAL